MTCPAYITNLANAIWIDIGQPADQPVSYIQSKLLTEQYVGKLSTLTAECYLISGNAIIPRLEPEAQAVYGMMYQSDFYTTKLNQVLAGLNPGVVELQEGDSRIRFTNPVEQAKVYKEMQKQINDQLQLLVASYRQDRALPESVNYPFILNIIGGYTYNTPLAGGPRSYYRS